MQQDAADTVNKDARPEDCYILFSSHTDGWRLYELARQPGYALDRDTLLLRKALQQLHVVARREQRHPAGSARGATYFAEGERPR